MGRFVVVWLAVLAGCGRIGFDAIGGTGDGGGDGRTGDGGFTPGSVTYVKASNPDMDDHYGAAIALSADGSTMAVGAYDEASNATTINGNQANNAAPGAGAVYVYVRTGGTWTQQAYLKAFNAEGGALFGTQVSLSDDGNTLAVSAPFEDSASTGINSTPNNGANDAGAVYVFRRSGTTWTQEAYIKTSNPNINDQFGTGMALSGNGTVLAVGAHFEDSNATGVNGNQGDNSASDAGAAYVFVRTGTWSQVAYLKASNTGTGDNFGEHVAVSTDGTTIAVGAYLENSGATGIDGDQQDSSAFAAGAVYVFAGGPMSWAQQAYVKSSNTQGSDQFGVNVALSRNGNVLAVTAHLEDGGLPGVGVSQTDESEPAAGAAYVLTRSGTTWSHETYFKASNPDQDDNFALRLALSADGGTLVVGAPGEASSATGINGNQNDESAFRSGAGYVFGRSGQSWSQLAYLKATNPEPGDQITTVALSADSSTIAVGAYQEAGGIGGINPNSADNSAPGAGAVYVFD